MNTTEITTSSETAATQNLPVDQIASVLAKLEAASFTKFEAHMASVHARSKFGRTGHSRRMQ